MRVFNYCLTTDDSINMSFLFLKKCLLLSFSIKSVCVYSVLNQCSVMTLPGSYSFGSEFRKAYLSFFLLSFSYSPFAFMVSLSAATHSGQHDTFLLELLFSFELLFPRTWSLSMLSQLSLALLVPPILRSCFTLSGQVPKGASQKLLFPLSDRSVSHSSPNSVFRPFHVLICKTFSTSGNSLWQEASKFLV